MKQVLFLCTGNYYRSRFAEIYFNHLAAKNILDWRADSRGLAVELRRDRLAVISPFALARLDELGVPLPANPRGSLQATIEDLERASLVVAMYDDEHRPFVQTRFPLWLDRIEFWRVPDIDEVAPDVALPALQKQVENLVERLQVEQQKVRVSQT